MMRSLLALFVTAMLGIVIAACDDSGKLASSQDRASTNGYLTTDGDKDNDDASHPQAAENDDATFLHTYGGHASSTDARAITRLVKSYYAAALARDGSKACPLLDATLAGGVAEEQTSQHGADCAESLSRLFRQQHQELVAEDIATMRVTAVHVKGNLGLAVLSFKARPESEIILEREGRVWKIDEPLGTYMP